MFVLVISACKDSVFFIYLQAEKEKDYDYSAFRLFHQRQHDSHVHPHPLAGVRLSRRLEGPCMGLEDRTPRSCLRNPVRHSWLLSDTRRRTKGYLRVWRHRSYYSDGRIQVHDDSRHLRLHHLHRVPHYQHLPVAKDIEPSFDYQRLYVFWDNWDNWDSKFYTQERAGVGE